MTATTKSLAEALALFQAEAPKFPKKHTAKVKTKTGGEYSYKYADLADILPVVSPLLAKHGLSWSSKPGHLEDGTPVLEYRLLHVSGEVDAGEMLLGVDANIKPQEMGSAITYARRYALTAQLNIVTDQDDDGRAANESERELRQPAPKSNGQPVATLDAAMVDSIAMAREEAGVTGEKLRLILIDIGVENVPQTVTKATIRSLTPEQGNALFARLSDLVAVAS